MEEGEYIKILSHKESNDLLVDENLKLKLQLKKTKWISVKDKPLPKDPLIKIIRWNLIHKCSVSVRYYPKHNKEMPWITNDISHCWPEESFAPYWKPEIEAPPEVSC